LDSRDLKSDGVKTNKERLMSWYLEVLKKYTVFSGRSRRKEYWFFVLFNILISVVLAIIDGVLGTASKQGGVGVLGGLYSLAVLIPSIAVGVRRLHDSGKSGWWLLISFVPCVGVFVLLYFLVQDSQPGENQFGPSPKALQA
jgi:uncharacterized membrane protein YhaH (DUF805 family)